MSKFLLFIWDTAPNMTMFLGLGLMIDNWDRHKAWLVMIGTLLFFIGLEVHTLVAIHRAQIDG